MNKKLLFLIIMILAGFIFFSGQNEKDINLDSAQKEVVFKDSKIKVEFDRVVDGDTIVISMNGEQERVRLIGVDTPESTTEHVSVECFGDEASQFLKDFLKDEVYLYIAFDDVAGQRDKYGRILAHVFSENGENINQTIISEGYGYEYTYRGQDYLYKDDYKISQHYAESNERGLWAVGVCNEEG